LVRKRRGEQSARACVRVCVCNEQRRAACIAAHHVDVHTLLRCVSRAEKQGDEAARARPGDEIDVLAQETRVPTLDAGQQRRAAAQSHVRHAHASATGAVRSAAQPRRQPSSDTSAGRAAGVGKGNARISAVHTYMMPRTPPPSRDKILNPWFGACFSDAHGSDMLRTALQANTGTRGSTTLGQAGK
jgi:hypothetical protein